MSLKLVHHGKWRRRDLKIFPKGGGQGGADARIRGTKSVGLRIVGVVLLECLGTRRGGTRDEWLYSH